MKKKNFQLLNKIVMVGFLVLLVLGFTVPGFLHSNTDNQQTLGQIAEPRLCRSDAECILVCDNGPVQVLCAQNLCLQNSCEEGSYYSFNSEPLSFSLSVMVNAEKVDLLPRINEQNQFVIFSESNEVNVFTRGLPLALILEKANIIMANGCIAYDSQTYCQTNEQELSLLVNGEESTLLEGYIPKAGDEIEVVYG